MKTTLFNGEKKNQIITKDYSITSRAWVLGTILGMVGYVYFLTPSFFKLDKTRKGLSVFIQIDTLIRSISNSNSQSKYV